MTAQQLKNSILQMAVQGKLVPQDPNDEPASVLLERIRAEKERLIKEKKIKREKNPSVIFKGADNTPYEKSAMKCGRWRMRCRSTSPIRGSGCGLGASSITVVRSRPVQISVILILVLSITKIRSSILRTPL